MTTQEINQALTIVRVKSIKIKHPLGYREFSGYALQHPTLGLFGFECDDVPYSPKGGKAALQAILDAGGFTDFAGSKWYRV